MIVSAPRGCSPIILFSDHSGHVGTSEVAGCICVERYPWGFLFLLEFHDLSNNVCLIRREALNNVYIKILYSRLFQTSYPFMTPSSFCYRHKGVCKYLCLNQGYCVERDNTFCSGRNLRKHHIIFSPLKAGSLRTLGCVSHSANLRRSVFFLEGSGVCMFLSEALLGCFLIFCL